MRFREFESRRLSATELESEIEYSIQAMEGVSQRDVELTRDLAHQLVASDLEDESNSPEVASSVLDVLQQLRLTFEHLAET